MNEVFYTWDKKRQRFSIRFPWGKTFNREAYFKKERLGMWNNTQKVEN